jgi:hypothetical protein
MSRQIVDRERELAELARLAKAPPALVIMRGRRRVGKTFLLRMAFPGERVASVQAEEKPRALQLEDFARACSGLALGAPPLRFAGWGDAFEFLERQASAAGPLVAILDEFQYLVASDPSLPSVVQRVWDRWDSQETPVALILSGSALSFMEGLLGGARPTYGRSVYRPLLSPLDYRDARFFAPPDDTPVDWIQRYGVLGGTPQYQIWAGRRPLSDVILQSILPTDSPLHSDPEHLIREEEGIRGPGPYFGVLDAIAHGYATTTAIASRLELSSQLANKFLNRLRDLSYVARVDPVEADGVASNRGHWRISDPYFRFWFRFVFLNRSRLARGRADEVAKEIKRDLPGYLGLVFEDCCREWVGRHPGLGAGALDVGSWWSRKSDIEIDVVTRDKRGYGLLGSCKWSKNLVREDVLDDLYSARSHLGPKAAQAKLALFARAGFAEPLKSRARREGVVLVDAAQLFEPPR